MRSSWLTVECASRKSLRRNPVVIQYDLRKVSEGWNVITDDSHLMYTLRPPWVRPQRFLPSTPTGTLMQADEKQA